MKKQYKVHICISHKPRVFGGGCCSDKGASELKSSLDTMLEDYELDQEVEVVEVNCLKQCLTGISLLVLPDRTYYGQIKSTDLPRIIEEHFINGTPVAELEVEPKKVSFLD
ncbi:MAG: (2Fe-2S) ferredoxin domain-containing protein [Bacteroidota bacterium]